MIVQISSDFKDGLENIYFMSYCINNAHLLSQNCCQKLCCTPYQLVSLLLAHPA